VWEAINKLDPQLFILTGDNVYADSADPAVLKASYDKFSAIPGFARLRASCPLLATWDDHDYGANDAGVEWEGKGAAKDAFMAFYGTPPESPMRNRGGVYDAHVFGPEGKRLQVILLDTRWFRGPLKRMSKDEEKKMSDDNSGWRGPYLPDPESDSSMIGEEQWKWLEEQLKVPAEIRLIVSSVQVLPEQHGFEKWGNLPRQRKRLFELIRAHARGVIFLSGDRHTADISKLPANTEGGPAYPLFDLTSSGLNQGGSSKEQNRYRVGTEDPFGQSNFGWITIDWEQKDPAIRLEIRDVEGKVVREARTTLAELSR
jgi:alkaline phosphatase D